MAGYKLNNDIVEVPGVDGESIFVPVEKKENALNYSALNQKKDFKF